MQTTTNYGLKVYEGTDLFNPLTVENVNTSDLDTLVKGVSDAAVGTATELLTGTVHALTRADTDRDVFHFTATADYEAGETFEVDGVQVTAKTPDGQNLSTGAYVINSSVLCILDGTLLTVIVNPAKALDSDKLDGHDSAYFATAGDLTILDNQVGAISSKVGTGVLTTTAQDCIGAINEVNAELTNLTDSVSVPVTSAATWNDVLPALFLACDLTKISGKSYIDSNGTYFHCTKKSATNATFSNTLVGVNAPAYTVSLVVANGGQAFNILNESTGAIASGLSSGIGFTGDVVLHY